MRSLVPHFRDRPVRPVGHSDVTLYKFTQFANVAIHLSPDSESFSKFTCMQKSVYIVSYLLAVQSSERCRCITFCKFPAGVRKAVLHLNSDIFRCNAKSKFTLETEM